MNLGFPEMVFLGLLALLIFGPRKLPEIGRQIGKALGEFKRASSEFQTQLEEEVRHLEKEAENTILPPTPPEGAVAKGAADPASLPASAPAGGDGAKGA